METKQCPEQAADSIALEREAALVFAPSRRALDTLSRQLSGERSVLVSSHVGTIHCLSDPRSGRGDRSHHSEAPGLTLGQQEGPRDALRGWSPCSPWLQGRWPKGVAMWEWVA